MKQFRQFRSAAATSIPGAPGIRISELPPANAANDADQFEVNQGGTSRRITAGQLGSLISSHGSSGYTVNVDALLTGPDTADPMAQLQALFASGTLDGKHAVFGANGRRYVFQTRPVTGLGPQNQYLTPPQKCILEWAPGCVWDFSAYPPSTAPTFMARHGTLGGAISTTGDLVKGQRAITVGAGQAAGLRYGDRVLLKATTQQTSLVGAFTLADNNPVPIIASISGTTLTVTDVTDVSAPGFDNPFHLNATLRVGSEIVEAGVTAATVIAAFGTGTGGLGTYTVNKSQTISSRVMMSATGSSARAEDLIVKSVSGNVVTFESRLQDDYPASTTPVLQPYVNEPELRLINPTALGPGWNGTQSDRMFDLRRGRNLIIEGGRLSNFAQPIRINGILGGRMSELQVFGIAENIAGGGISFNDGVSSYLVENCVTWGGSQMFMLSSQGDGYGIMRDVTFSNCIAHGALNGFSTHNTHERISYQRCQVNDASSVAFDIRVPNVTMTDCVVRRAGGAAVYLRPNGFNFVCDRLWVDKALSGIVFQEFPLEYDFPPSHITIRDCHLLRIGGIGSGGALNLAYAINDAGTFPVLGPLHVTGNYISMTDLTLPIEITGRWTNPVIEDNTLIAEGVSPAGAYMVMGTPQYKVGTPSEVIGGPTDGPSNPTVRRNSRNSWGPPSISSTTGAIILDPQSIIGTSTTVPVALTASTSLLAAQQGQAITNRGATGPLTVTLAPATSTQTQRFEIYVAAAQQIEISGGGVPIRIGSGVPAFNLRSSVVGAWARLTMTSSLSWVAEVDDIANWMQDWSPFALGAGLIAWWDVLKPPTDSSSGSFRWSDLVRDQAFIQATTASKPVFNGASVDFTGDKYLQGFTPIDSAFPVGATAGCIWASVDQTVAASDVAQRHIMSYGGDDYDNSRAVGRTSATSVNRGFASVGDGTQKMAIHAAVDLTGLHWLAAIYNGTTMTCRIDGVSSGNVTTVGATSNLRMRMGADAGTAPTLFFNSKIKRVLITGLLSAPDQASLEAWLTAHI